MKALRRIRIGLTSVAFFMAALACCIAPSRVTAWFGAEVAGGADPARIATPLGGLFLGVAAMLAVGAFTLRKGALFAAATMFGAIATVRVAAWIAHPGASLAVRALAFEAGTVCALLLLARGLPRPRTPSCAP